MILVEIKTKTIATQYDHAEATQADVIIKRQDKRKMRQPASQPVRLLCVSVSASDTFHTQKVVDDCFLSVP